MNTMEQNQIICRKRKIINDGIYYVILIIFTAVVGYISLGRGFDFDVMACTTGDGFWSLEFIKSIQENGFVGAWFNDRVGVPDGSAIIDFPSTGYIDISIYWILSWFTDSTPRIAYYFLILSFVLDGVAMTLLLRKLQFKKETSFVVGCLFAFAPYHFYRYLGHISLIMYFTIPIALYLGCYIVGIIDEDRKWKLILATILLGIGYGYYYAFGLIIIAIAYLIKLIKADYKKEILKYLWIGILLCITIAAGLFPKVLYALLNGHNTDAGVRSFVEQEIYGLKIINLLLPVMYSRIDFLKNLTVTYTSKAPLVNENQLASMGFVASAGFIILLVSFIISCIKKKKNKPWELIDYLAILTIAFLLIGTIGGFGEIFNWMVTAQVRCYNRSSIVLTGVALIMIAILIDKIRGKKRIISIITCVLVLVVGMFDQVNISGDNWQESIRETQEMYEAYFGEVEETLGDGTMVYQLPYMEFPEAGGVNDVSDYKLFAGYLFTDTLRWSYGSVRGRNESSRTLNIDNGMSFQFLNAIKDAGFGAVYIDLDGYADDGEQIVFFYDSLGLTPIVSDDDKLYVYDISDLEIGVDQLASGYSFVWNYTKLAGAWLDDEDLVELANGLVEKDIQTYHTLFELISRQTDIKTDGEYIDFLYNTLLGRDADEEGKESKLNSLQADVAREEIFYTFLQSEEFTNKWLGE